jgi:hypothetical protein
MTTKLAQVMETRRRIRVMEHYADGGVVLYRDKLTKNDWKEATFPCWDWSHYYREGKKHELPAVELEIGSVVNIPDQKTSRWLVTFICRSKVAIGNGAPEGGFEWPAFIKRFRVFSPATGKFHPISKPAWAEADELIDDL